MIVSDGRSFRFHVNDRRGSRSARRREAALCRSPLLNITIEMRVGRALQQQQAVR